MKILAFDSSASAASVCFMADGEIKGIYYQDSGLTHSKTLLKMAQDMMDNMGLAVKDLDMVAVSKGPGSFTGIRIGVAAAKGLAWGGDLKICGVSTLEAAAYQFKSFEDCVICPVMDARHGQVYNGEFIWDGAAIVRSCPDRVISIQDLCAEAKDCGKRYLLVGDGAGECAKAFSQAGLPYIKAPDYLANQNAAGVAMAAEVIGPQDDVTPNYLRLSQAERERHERMKNEKTGK